MSHEITDNHCPDHKGHPGKVEGNNNTLVLPEGTQFCVKGSTDATAILTADGETTLVAYLNNGHDVSYYINYGTTTTTTGPGQTVDTTTTTTTTTPIFTVPLPPETTITYPNDEGGATACVTPDGYPFLTSYPECPVSHAEVAQPSTPTQVAELPQTGLGGVLLVIALVLLLSGLVSVAIGKLIAHGR